MNDVAGYVPLSGVIRLDSPLASDVAPAAVLDRALELVPALAGVCSPLALLLLVGVRTPGVPALDYEPEPAQPAWQIVESGLPPSVDVHAPESAVRSYQTTLSPEVLRRWGRLALAQAAPSPDLEVMPALLRCAHARARVGPLDADEYQLSDRGDLIGLPVEQRPDGPYVLAPAHHRLLQPPVAWSVGYDGDLVAELWLNWTPWLDPRRYEGAQTIAAVHQLQDGGWRLREPFDPLGLAP